MNLEQLENVLKQIEIIEMLIEDDTDGASNINQKLDPFKETVQLELKNLVWVRYLKERD